MVGGGWWAGFHNAVISGIRGWWVVDGGLFGCMWWVVGGEWWVVSGKWWVVGWVGGVLGGRW